MHKVFILMLLLIVGCEAPKQKPFESKLQQVKLAVKEFDVLQSSAKAQGYIEFREDSNVIFSAHPVSVQYRGDSPGIMDYEKKSYNIHFDKILVNMGL